MPAHIYQRVGRYEDVIKVEHPGGQGRRGLHRAVPRAGDLSARLLPAQPALHLDGRDRRAGRASSRSTRRSGSRPRSRTKRSKDVPILQGFLVVPYWAMVRFEKWDDILADKGPQHDTPFTRGVWHYASAMAFDRQGPARRQRRRSWRSCSTIIADPSLTRPDHVLEQHRDGDSSHRAGSDRRPDRRRTEGLGQGDPSPRSRDPLRGRAPLPGTARLARAGAAGPWQRAARRRTSRRSGSGVLGGPEAQPRERLVAHRPGRRPQGAERRPTTPRSSRRACKRRGRTPTGCGRRLPPGTFC